MIVNVKDLTGPALDWAVAKCEGFGPDTYMRSIDIRKNMIGKVTRLLVPINRDYVRWSPTTDWSQGGPIIEREKISTNSDYNGAHPDPWAAETYSGGLQQAGPTPLIAAMRCYVASKFGDTIEIPEELTS